MYQGEYIEIVLTESHKFDASEYSDDPDFDPADDAKKVAKDSTYDSGTGTCKGALKELEYIVLFKSDKEEEHLVIDSIQAKRLCLVGWHVLLPV